MTVSRRAFISRAVLAAAGGAALFAVRDRLPWPPLDVRIANGRDTPWQRLPQRPGLVEITVSVNGAPIRAVVDSGAQISAVDAGLAERLRLQRILAAPLLAYGVSGGPSLTHTVRLNLSAPGLAVPRLRAAVLDLAGIAAASGRDFHLLIGRDVLSRLVVEVDFPLRRARFLQPGIHRPAHDAITVPLAGGAPAATVHIEAAAPMDLLVDTGATGFLALSEAAARRAGLTAPGRPVSRGLSVSLSGLNPERTVRARIVRMGGLTLRDVPVQIFTPATNAPAASGLIGAGLLQPFRVALDLPARRLHLTPPAITILRS
ncbi:aspartyl protease family protein [uncultured Phenylobacterium sp.]|uniref:aspartyl protease family protein n=1 Tax=uncultured Phenylobacterium sp. TaxID=349273 RepID=UPI0025E2E43D|nr:aspartyl protease family protein [uncultured Phenylobacterium sp.]